MMKRFWTNLGLNYKDIEQLPLATTDMLMEIMKLEEQYESREITRQTKK